MEKFKQLQRIKEIYASGGNIIQFLKSLHKDELNTIEDILISYDFQSGTYLKTYAQNRTYNENYCSAIASVIDGLGPAESLMEVGVGEATTFSTVIRKLKSRPAHLAGFDIAWSRLSFAKNLLADLRLDPVRLFTANLFEIPLPDNSIDIIYTSHSLEPNGGHESAALRELFRVARKYLVLLEPSYEFASPEARERMQRHGYVTELYAVAKKEGYKIIEHRPFEFTANPLNPTGLIVIEKLSSEANSPALVCPISRTPLMEYDPSLLYSPDSFLAYPVVRGIPCLLKENSILATHLLTDYQKFKSEHSIVI